MRNRGDMPRKPVLRKEYRPPAWLVDEIDLHFRLDAERTRVRGVLKVRRNPDAQEDTRAPLVLAGADLQTLSISIDGRRVPDRSWRIDGESLVLAGVPDQATVTTEVAIRPERNTALEGMYESGGMLLTQCEAEGFRKITWFPDRPDVMTRYRVRLEADRARYPLLLSNGNPVDAGKMGNGRHFVVWEDPFPKPSYLFAIVAGDLGCLEDEFVTASGRRVALKLYTERENLCRLQHAMDSLKNAMRWDEERFGLEYDLDIYHIVATHDFNMGAMENKSLNIFNAKYVLADPETATDRDYQDIEGVIGHEYFHNWTGNRVTCRDWFQLTLKEGLTVYRDQEFSADRQSRAVKRIEDLRMLRQRQYPEDAGPMAHPVRPERYFEINNFYTATVYEKGAEVVRMYETLLGRDGFRKGLDLYFRRHDGRAVTCDDFLTAMADANGRDLAQFGRWYRQVGTPTLSVTSRWDEANGTYELNFAQSLPEQRDNEALVPLLVPVRAALLDRSGNALPAALEGDSPPESGEHLLIIDRPDQQFRFTGLEAEPLPSILRGGSAPVHLEYDWDDDQLACLAACDRDPVARWEAGRRLAERVLLRSLETGAPEASEVTRLAAAWRPVIEDRALDPALAVELLTLPSEMELAEAVELVDAAAIHGVRETLRHALAANLAGVAEARFRELDDGSPWMPDAAAVGGRRLCNHLLGMLALVDDTWLEKTWQRYRSADNMTNRQFALALLVHRESELAGDALADFERRFGTNPLVMDKWFAVQAARPAADTLDSVKVLLEHPAFSARNPNKVRALLGTFAQFNSVAFHRPDGAGYEFHADQIIALDGVNPQVAARLAAAFNRWRRFQPAARSMMQKALERIAARKGLSPHVGEIVSAALKEPAL